MNTYCRCATGAKLYFAGRLPIDKLITHHIKLDEINLGFDRLANGEAIRQVIVF